MLKDIRLYLHPRILAVLCLGFSSGLPVALTASTFDAWLKKSGVSLTSIGLLALATTPYALKFLWAPLIDGLQFPVLSQWLGRRRGWLIATQSALVVLILLLGLTNPAVSPWLTGLMALMVAVASASQDIVVDAFRVEILAPEHQGAGAAAAVLGWRLGSIASGAGALYLADYTSWTMVYGIMAVLMGIGMLTTMLSPEPEKEIGISDFIKSDFTHWMREHVLDPFLDFMCRPHWAAILLFIIFYKLGDAFMGVMTNPFLIEIGFSMEQIAKIVKLYGIIATILGSFIGGALVFRLGAMRSLWICGIMHAATNLMFVLQARAGADTGLLALSITLENISGGMGTSAFVAYLSGLTHARFTATQYALLSSLAAFGRTWLSTPSGWFAEKLGWEVFFTLSAALAIPGLALLFYLRRLHGATAISPPAAMTSE